MKNEKAKHTPGPWRLEHTNLRPDPWFHTVYKESNRAITTVATLNRTEHGGLPGAEANAALIAASPALLAALDKCARVLANIGTGNTATGDYLDALGEARAAIAKAKGE